MYDIYIYVCVCLMENQGGVKQFFEIYKQQY